MVRNRASFRFDACNQYSHCDRVLMCLDQILFVYICFPINSVELFSFISFFISLSIFENCIDDLWRPHEETLHPNLTPNPQRN